MNSLVNRLFDRRPYLLVMMRILLVLLFFIVAYNKIWIILGYIIVAGIDVYRKKRLSLILDCAIILFALICMFPWSRTYEPTYYIHFNLLEKRYEKELNKYSDLTEYNIIDISNYKNGDTYEVLSYQNNDIKGYTVCKKNPFLYHEVLINEKVEAKSIFFVTSMVNQSGYMYLSNESSRKMEGINTTYATVKHQQQTTIITGSSNKSVTYYWLNNHWIYITKVTS